MQGAVLCCILTGRGGGRSPQGIRGGLQTLVTDAYDDSWRHLRLWRCHSTMVGAGAISRDRKHASCKSRRCNELRYCMLDFVNSANRCCSGPIHRSGQLGGFLRESWSANKFPVCNTRTKAMLFTAFCSGILLLQPCVL